MNIHGDKSITNSSGCKVNKEKCLSQQTWNGGNPRDFILNMHAWPLSVESRVHVRIEAYSIRLDRRKLIQLLFHCDVIC